MKFKIGDRVKIIRRCDCTFAYDCECCNGEVSGIIVGYDYGNNHWTVNNLLGRHQCHFAESQLKLIEKIDVKAKIEVYGIVKFLEGLKK
jgi:hypothetical protein